MNWYTYEAAANEKGYQYICGIDEAGRGPLAGPVFAAAVILPQGLMIDGLNDSKKMTEKKTGGIVRSDSERSDRIFHCICYGTGNR